MSWEGWHRAFEQLPYLLEMLLSGAVTTIELTVSSFALAVILGLAFAVFRTQPARLPQAIAATYVEIFRAVPVLTQLFVLYFGLASIGLRLDPLPAAILGFGINGGAYLTEVFRAGIQSVHRGQMEAAFAIGMTRRMGLRYIVLPQAMRVVLPPLGNYAIGLLKETALASAVAAPELTFRGRMLIDQTYLSSQIYLLVALLYLTMSLPMTHWVRRLERRMTRGQR